METTENYKLPQWVKADQIKMDDFNGAFGKIDAALKANADAAASKAEASVVTAIAQTLADGKLCRIQYGSYVGDGTYGTANANRIDCDFCPLLILVGSSASSLFRTVRGIDSLYWGSNRSNTVVWGDDYISWYYQTSDTSYDRPTVQLNEANTTYYYVVIGYSEET